MVFFIIYLCKKSSQDKEVPSRAFSCPTERNYTLGFKCYKTEMLTGNSQALPCSDKKPHFAYAYSTARGASSGPASLDFWNQINSYFCQFTFTSFWVHYLHSVCCEEVSVKNVNDLSIMEDHVKEGQD